MKKKILTLLPLIIIALLLYFSLCSTCGGFGYYVLLILLGCVYLITLLIIVLVDVIGNKGFKQFNYYPLIFTLIFSILILYKLAINKWIYDSSNSILTAHCDREMGNITWSNLELLSNGRYIVTIVIHHDIYCKYYGKYRYDGNMLFLDKDVIKLTKGYFVSNILLVDKSKKLLKPIGNNRDSIYWFNILKDTSH